MRIDTPTKADIPDLARVHVQSWRAVYAGLLDASYLAGLSVEERMLSWQRILAAGESSTWVARDEAGRVQAFLSHGPCRDRDAPPDRAEIWALYAHPDMWGRGAGRRLMDCALHTLRAQGMASVSLWVLRGNRRGIRFYEAAGFAEVPGSVQRFELGGSPVEELAMLRFLTEDPSPSLPGESRLQHG